MSDYFEYVINYRSKYNESIYLSLLITSSQFIVIMVVPVVVVMLMSLLIVVVLVGISITPSDVLLFDLTLDVFLLELYVLLFLIETAYINFDLLNWGILFQSKSYLQQLLEWC